MKKTKLTQQVLMALLLGSSLLPGSMAQAAELTVTTDQSGNISLPGSGNTLTIESGTINGYAYGGFLSTGNVTGNTVTMNGGTVTTVYGGFVNNTGTAAGNTVTIRGGTVTKAVYGGQPQKGNATGNTVNLYGGDLTTASIYGGAAGGDGSISTGNTLNVYAPLTVNRVYYFQNYNFYIPATLTGSTALLTLSSSAVMVDTTVSAIGIARDSAYTTGSTITLLSSSNIQPWSSLASNTVTAQKGIATLYPAVLTLTTGTNGTFTATLGEASVNPKVKSFSEAQSATLANLNTGADLAAGRGLANAVTAAAGGNGQAVGFAGTSAGQQTISTGSEVDGRSFGLMAGAAATRSIAAGRLTTGVFAEAGWGSFTTANEVSSTTVNADGHSNYEGGGILARLERPDGVYYEGSLHAGHMDSTYASSDVTDYLGNGTSYDVGSPYYSAHMGLGRVWQLGQKNQMDVYGTYLWSYVPSRSVTVAEDAFDFASVASNRLRLGARWTKRCDDGSVYAGLAAEREFSGSQHGTAAGLDMPAPSLSGTTGIAELGWRVPQTAGNPFGLDLSLTGLFGKRQGITGGVSFIWGW